MRNLILTTTILLFLYGPVIAEFFYLEDGGIHTINDNQYQNDSIFLDYSTANDPGTHLELANGGSVLGVNMYHKSSATVRGSINWGLVMCDSSTAYINGGVIETGLSVNDNSMVTINDGSVGGIRAVNYSVVEVNAGTIIGDIEALWDTHVIIHGGMIHGKLETYNSTVEISGGTIDLTLSALGNGTIYLHGSGFSVGGQDLSFGDSLRDYGTIVESHLTGTIVGTLQDGSELNNVFYIRTSDTDANIIVVPEPLTILLISIGGLFLNRRFNKNQLK